MTEPPHGKRAATPEAIELAYRYVNVRERTAAELRAYLSRRVEDTDRVEAAVDQLTADGYVDDARYARLFIEDKRTLEGWGTQRIRRGLLEHGVDREIAERALQESAGEPERDRAFDVLRQRFPDGVRDRRERERALGVLLRKGYDGELAIEVVRRWSRREDAEAA